MDPAPLSYMCSSLASILATIANNADIPYKVSVCLNNAHLGDMKRSLLAVSLGGMSCEVGDTITLEEVWNDDYCCGMWEEGPIVIHLLPSGWFVGACYQVENTAPSPTFGVRLRTRGLSHAVSEVQYSKSEASRGNPRRDYKRAASRSARRAGRAFIEEGKVG